MTLIDDFIIHYPRNEVELNDIMNKRGYVQCRACEQWKHWSTVDGRKICTGCRERERKGKKNGHQHSHH